MTSFYDRTLFCLDSTHEKDILVLNWRGQPIEGFNYYAGADHPAAVPLISIPR